MDATIKGNSGAGHKKKRFSYKSDIIDAHDIGYAMGWDNAYNIPDKLFAKTVASYGFRKGMRDKFRTDKYAKTYQKKGTKN